jgi:hypothetical protein
MWLGATSVFLSSQYVFTITGDEKDAGKQAGVFPLSWALVVLFPLFEALPRL